MTFLITSLQPEDWAAVKAVYVEGIQTGIATFETDPPSWETWNKSHCPDCRLVARSECGEILGWAALTPVSNRCVYAGVAEVSVYVAAAAQRQGVGKALLQALIQASEQAGFWTLQSGIMADNEASIHLHLSLGFRLVGIREKIGKLAGTWRDTVLLERRSQNTGID